MNEIQTIEYFYSKQKTLYKHLFKLEIFMQSKLLLHSLLFSLIILSTVDSFGQKPFKEALEGQIQRYNSFAIGYCKASDITVKYRLSTTLGEPTVFLNFKWKSIYFDDPDCLNEVSFEVFIEVYIGYAKYYIPADGALGSIPEGDNTWGNNPLSSSPNWNKLFLTSLNGIVPKRESNRTYVNKDIAKGYWQSGFRVAAVIFLDRDGNINSVY